MTVILPLRSDLPDYSFSVELDGITFELTFTWNDRDSAWYMSLADGDGVAIADGIKIVLGPPLMWRESDARMPPGRFVVFDSSGAGADAGLTDLGGRVQVLYYDRAEFV